MMLVTFHYLFLHTDYIYINIYNTVNDITANYLINSFDAF